MHDFASRIRSAAFLAVVFVAFALLSVSGCVDQPSMGMNPDPTLRLKTEQFVGDASSRMYDESAPRQAEARARASVGYGCNRIEIVNFTGADWEDVELWVNRQYVCHIPKMQDRKLKIIYFTMLYDAAGKPFPSDNNKYQVKQVEVLRDGTLYSITCHHADF